MSEELKARIRKLSAQATQAKMDLHDLSEELPIGWERIPEQARLTHDAFAALAEARKQVVAKEQGGMPTPGRNANAG